ncbi:104aa long hypothetical protein [Pyrococcus horikoshii OT3]|uniref:Uncharacterized protein n=1 Tax=Pyrococcus horikoshii (strain ATCC 700860 / DSM 12428 / JCM 9974 / NBRC 100139 / OT-3) TaxID=70601 RepID=O59325_PYRHO|nr:104aa long hypothetical protein [Pyrococcus horikoshii OT3]
MTGLSSSLAFPFKNSTRILAASSGDVAKTPENILTPVGIPRIGISLSTASVTSLAVPSPPANNNSSAPFFTISLASTLVSSAEVSGILTPIISLYPISLCLITS